MVRKLNWSDSIATWVITATPKISPLLFNFALLPLQLGVATLLAKLRRFFCLCKQAALFLAVESFRFGGDGMAIGVGGGGVG